MSEIARWSYENTATIRPFVGINDWSGQITYGPEYEIDCNWIAESAQTRSNDGAEFISKHVIYTEDARPKHLDMVKLNGMDDWEEIRAKTSWDMAMFQDTLDFKLVTG